MSLIVLIFFGQDFRSLLVDELSKQFPKEIEEYQQIKQRQSKP